MAETQLSDGMMDAVEKARTIFAMESPIINLVVGILVLYVVIYFITFQFGPVLFGYPPYRPHAFFARTMHHVTRRAAEMNGEAATGLTAMVADAIQKTF